MKVRFVAAITAAALALGVTAAFAASTPSGHGLPSVSCGDPGATSAPPGFGTGGFPTADSHYNPIAQYDVACYQRTHAGG